MIREEKEYRIPLGGIKRKTNPFVEQKAGLYSCKNFHSNEVGSLTKWNGFTKLNSVQLLESGTPATFVGIFDFVKSNLSRYIIGVTTKGVYRFGTPTANAWNLVSALPAGFGPWTAADISDFAVLNDQLYITTGAGNLRYDGTSLFRVGIIPPATANPSGVASLNGAGVLTGAYSYKVTFFNTAIGLESNPGTSQSNTVTATANQILLSTLPTTTDPQVDKMRIYRTTTGGGVWLFLAEIAIASTTFSDNNPDSALGIAIEEFANGVPPQALTWHIFKGRLFIVPRLAAQSSLIFFSKEGQPGAVDPNDFRELGEGDGDKIMVITELTGNLVAFKTDSIWNGFGEDRDTFGFNKQVPSVGAGGPFCVATEPNFPRLLFRSEIGFYSYNGIGVEYISSDIEPLMGDFTGNIFISQVVIYKIKNVAIWLARRNDEVETTTLILFDYLQGTWYLRLIPNTKGNALALIENPTSIDSFYLGGHGGHVFKGDSGGSDDGSAIAVEVIDLPISGKKRGGLASFYRLVVFFDPEAGSTLDCAIAKDDPTGTYTSVGTINLSATSGEAILTFDVQARRIYLRFSHTQINQPVILRGWEVYYRDLQRVAA